jgi:hypothetical protein
VLLRHDYKEGRIDEKNDKTYILSILILMFTLLAINPAQAANYNIAWGHQKTIPDYEEQQIEQITCQEISNSFQSRSGWNTWNAYGQNSKSSTLQQTISWRQQNDVWATDFWVGDFFGAYVSGTMHYYFYGDQADHVLDTNVYSWTNSPYSKQQFTFIWTCACGNVFANPFTQSNCYGYFDDNNGNNTGEVGMPLAWTARSDLSINGYNSPDNSGYCYIGHQGPSLPLKEYTSNPSYTYRSFVTFFYGYLTMGGVQHTVKESLDYASNIIWGGNWQNPNNPLGYGHYTWDPISQQYVYVWTNVFGDSNLNLP